MRVTPSPLPRSFSFNNLQTDSAKIFEFKGLTRKIFPAKDLAQCERSAWISKIKILSKRDPGRRRVSNKKVEAKRKDSRFGNGRVFRVSRVWTDPSII
jgi:hypothetical protein